MKLSCTPHHLIISSSHHFIPSSFHPLIISSPPHFIPTSSHPLIISSSHHLIISSSHHLILSSPHPLIISSAHHLIISSPHHLIPSSFHPPLHAKRAPTTSVIGALSIKKKEAATYSPALHCSTIGASRLNFSVRNGKRWDPAAITT